MLFDKTSCFGIQHSWLLKNQSQFKEIERLKPIRSIISVKPKHVPQHEDFWMKKPPDFSIKHYTSLQLPTETVTIEEQINKRKYFKKPKDKLRVSYIHLPDLVKKEEPKQFQRTFPHFGSFEAKLMSVKNGHYPKGKYTDPKPHDFRQYETDIPDFVTHFSRDSSNVRFKSQHLSSVYGLQPSQHDLKYTDKKKLIFPKPKEPIWEQELFFPKNPWPTKSAAYTRHRIRRGAYTAFMDRVEEQFNANIEALSK